MFEEILIEASIELPFLMFHLAPVVQKLDSAIHRIIDYPLDKY